MITKKRKGATEKRSGGSGIASLIWMFVGSVLTLMVGLFLYLWNPFDMGDAEPVTTEREVQPLNNTNETGDGYEFYDLLPTQEITSIPNEAIEESSDTETELTVQERALQQALLEPDVVVNAPEDDVSESDDETANLEEDINSDTAASVTQDSSDDGAALDNPQSGLAQNQPINENNIVIESSTPNLSYILQINSFSSAEEADTRRAQVLMAGVDARVVKKTMENGQTFYQVVSPPMYNRQAVIAAQQRLQNNGIDSLIVEQRHQ